MSFDRTDPPRKNCDFARSCRDKDWQRFGGKRALRRHNWVPPLPGKLLAKSLEARGFIQEQYFWRAPNGWGMAVSDVRGIDQDHAKCPGTTIADLLTAIDEGVRVNIGYDHTTDQYTVEAEKQ